jgi:hypothetical protein
LVVKKEVESKVQLAALRVHEKRKIEAEASGAQVNGVNVSTMISLIWQHP